MKTSKLAFPVAIAASSLLALTSPLSAADFYFDPSVATPPSWFSSQWSSPADGPPYNQAWDNTAANNNVARWAPTASGNYRPNLGSNLVNFGSGGLHISTPGGATVRFDSNAGGGFSFDGGSVVNTSVNLVDFVVDVVTGNFSLDQGTLSFTTTSAYSGTVTQNTSGTAGLIFNSFASTSTSSHAVINSGLARFTGRNNGVRSFGDLTMAVGSTVRFDLGPSSAAALVSVNSLSGGGGAITLTNEASAVESSLTVNQSTDTTFTGSIGGQNNNHRLAFQKSGGGILTLDGSSLELPLGTVVSGGTLLINGGATRDFQHASGSEAITVANGGTLGGTSTLAIFGGDHVVVLDGGSLAPGNGVGNAGRTTFSFQSGGSLDLSGVTTGSDWLKFDLGAPTTPGTTYDQIRVTNGTLNIGSGILNFDDFDFNPLAGFDEGTYTLFDLTGTSTLSGTLGSSLSGTVSPGLLGTISLSGSNIILDVIPEPTAGLLGLLGVGAVALLRRRKR